MNLTVNHIPENWDPLKYSNYLKFVAKISADEYLNVNTYFKRQSNAN